MTVCEFFVGVLQKLPDRRGTMGDVFDNMHRVDRDWARATTTADLVLGAKAAKAAGAVEIAHDPKRKVDVITLVA